MKKLLSLALVLTGTLCQAQNFVSNFSGNGIPGLANGSPAMTNFYNPFGICRDSAGNLYVADGDNHCIRRVDPSGNSSVYAGTAIAGFADGPALSAMFNNPINLCMDAQGDLYVSDFLNQRIRRISASGMVTTVAGSGVAGFANGLALSSRFNYPRGIAIDSLGNIYVADSWNHRIRKIDGSTHNVSTYAGGGTTIGVGSVGGLVDGPDTAARFYTPSGLTMDASGSLYVADPNNHRIRRIDTSRVVTTVAGSGATGPGSGGFLDGNALSALLNTPTDLFWMPDGNLLISDTYNNRVRLLDTSGTISSYAGSGIPGYSNGPDSLAEFNFPRGVIANPAGDTVFVVDYNNHTVRLICPCIPAFTSERDGPFDPAYAYPNPSSGRLIRISRECSDATVVISNLLGQECCRIEDFSGNAVLLPAALHDGTYIMTILKNRTVLFTSKLVIAGL